MHSGFIISLALDEELTLGTHVLIDSDGFLADSYLSLGRQEFIDIKLMLEGFK